MQPTQDVAFSDHELKLIRLSFARLIPVSDRVASEFYALLFERCPDVRPMFPDDMTEQKDKFVLMLANLVDAADDTKDFEHKTRLMGTRHIGYGAVPAHYAAVGAALMDTMRRSDSLDLTVEETEAWLKLYNAIADGMIQAS